MAAQVIAIRNSAAQSRGWSTQELAEVFRLTDMLQRHGVDLAIDYGVSDEGDPWLVLTDPLDAEISFHIARIDQRYVVARSDSEEIAVKRHLREVAELVVPANRPEELLTAAMAEPLELYAVVALALASTQVFEARQAELKEVLGLVRSGDGELTQRPGLRDAESRIDELARVLVAAIGAAEIGQQLRPASALPITLPFPSQSHASTPGAVPSSANQLAIYTVSTPWVDRLMAPAQRDLTAPPSVVRGDAPADGTAPPLVLSPALPAHKTLPDLSSDQDSIRAAQLHVPSSTSLSIVPVGLIGDLQAGLHPIVETDGTLPTPSAHAASTTDFVAIGPSNAGQLFDFSSISAGLHISVSNGTATIIGGSGPSAIELDGHNLLLAGSGTSTVTIDSGSNTIVGGSGSTYIAVLNGNNSIVGGSGSQSVLIDHGNNTVTAGSGALSVSIAGGSNTVNSGSAGSNISIAGGSNSVAGGTGNDSVSVSGGNNTIAAGSGNDTIHVSGGNNTVIGGTGNSLVGIDGGSNLVLGGSGHDSVSVGGSGKDSADGGVTVIIGGTSGTTVDVSSGASSSSGSTGHSGDSGTSGDHGLTVVGVSPDSHTSTT